MLLLLLPRSEFMKGIMVFVKADDMSGLAVYTNLNTFFSQSHGLRTSRLCLSQIVEALKAARFIK